MKRPRQEAQRGVQGEGGAGGDQGDRRIAELASEGGGVLATKRMTLGSRNGRIFLLSVRRKCADFGQTARPNEVSNTLQPRL